MRNNEVATPSGDRLKNVCIRFSRILTCRAVLRQFSGALSLAAVLFFVVSAAVGGEVDYLLEIKPILRERCFACHGGLKQEGKLRLDTAALATAGGESGPAIRPGDVPGSVLIQRVSESEESVRMPPVQEGEALTVAQIELLRRWITEGAKAPAQEQAEEDPATHWAFQPIVRPPVPQSNSEWVRNPIDAFLQERHRIADIKPQPEAARIVLLRRLSLDLIGIPPTVDELAAFEADRSPDWYERTVQRLLEDPRHGERWARHWMDIWRYSDWWGLGDQLRNSQKHIWHWRDWIVESLNEDTGYDEMVRQMLAADELYPSDPGKLRATGYLARNYWLFNRPQWMEETVEHVSKGFLGLTMNCARCHDHKFDPLEQADYYRMRAFFEPYHVRLDVVPGEADLARDGIPRVFDGRPDDPTYLYIRGDERNPDKSRVISPGIPKILAFRELRVEPISLPEDAWQPDRRPWVPAAFLEAAASHSAAVEAELVKAQDKLTAAEMLVEEMRKKELNQPAVNAVDSAAGAIIAERFETLDPARWELIGGKWVHEPGQLIQKQDGAERAALRWMGEVPRDFDVTIRFTITGGSKWRSVGLAFDVSPEDPAKPAAATDSEQNVYISAVEGGSKIQVAWQSGGEWHYPGGRAVRAMPIVLNQPYELRVQVRGRLINGSLNGEPLVAFETPFQRRAGALQLITFDALTTVHEVRISLLDSNVVLKPADASVSEPETVEAAQAAVADALLEVGIAEAAVMVARSEVTGVERRMAAQQAEQSENPTANRELVMEAVKSERQIQLAKARYKLVQAERAQHRAAPDGKGAAEQAVKNARDALEAALAASAAEIQPSDTYSRFVGAAWIPTRFFNSGTDDPQVSFQSQSSGRRRALAEWITDRRNPLTARVAVNHLWTRHMGQALVPTMFDFGRKGTPPTHPELLDWLASELIDSGWSMKHLHRLITTSAAWRLSSSASGAEAAMVRDPENHLWWRRPAVRMESQLVRDSLLALSGTLDSACGGPSVPVDQQATSRRRSLYFFHSNNERNLFLTMFDEALVKDCYRREQSIVPQQALALSNSALALDSAEQIAGRLAVIFPDEEAFVRNTFRLVTGIHPNADELSASRSALDAWRKLPGSSDSAARMNLVWVLINHNDFVTIR